MIVNPPFAQGGIPLSAYWRIHITDAGTNSGSSNFVKLSNVEFRAVIGGSNVATGGTPTASSTDATSSSVSVLFNGNTNGQWFSDMAGALPVNIDYHFTSAQRIAEIALSFANSTHAGGVTDLNHPPLKFDLQYSLNGGSSYLTLWTFDMTASGWVPGFALQSRFAVFTSPVWYQIYITAPSATGDPYQVAQAELHSTAGSTTNLAVNGFASATSTQTYIAGVPNYPHEPWNNTDSPDYVTNGGYGWLSQQNPASPPLVLSYGFYYPVSTMREISMTMIDDVVLGFRIGRAPTSFKIRKSTNFSTWTDLLAQSTSWTTGVQQSFSW